MTTKKDETTEVTMKVEETAELTPAVEPTETEAPAKEKAQAQAEANKEDRASEKSTKADSTKEEVDSEAKSDGSEKKKAAAAKPVETPQLEPLKDFDWSQVDYEIDSYSAKEREELEKMYEETLSSIGALEVVDGTVVAKNKREVIVNIGFKSEGVISLSEFRYNPDLAVGDKVEVYIEIQEDKNGQLVLSHKKARALQAWDKVNSALNTDEVINGYVKCRTKGGLIVDVFGIEAFLPGSQIDVKPVRDYDIYVGKTMEFRVVKINKEFKNVVVSHKALIESELKEQRKEIISKLEKGQVLEGTVKNITSYGVFMDLGGVDGLIHITDLSWGRISHPEEIVKLDEKLNVVILDFDENKTRIQLGLKQLNDHPWDSMDDKLETGKRVKGKVVVVADYGAFVEVAPGIEGLIHVSEMSWSQHLRSAQDFLKVGDEVDAEILTLDKEERKMSLGIKQLLDDPWTGVDKKYPTDSKHKGIIRNFTNYGIFVELEEGVDGLIHISDLSWSKKIKHPSEFAELGDEIEVVILELDTNDRKVSLGKKQLEENPWEVFETVFTIDSVHKGTVTSVNEKGAIVTLPYGVEGFAPSRHIVKDDGNKAQVDDTLEFHVLEFSKENRRILLTHTGTHSEGVTDKKKPKAPKKDKEKSVRKAVKDVRDNLEKTTLGDIDALSSLKSEIEAAEENTENAEEVNKAPEVDDSAPKEEKSDKSSDMLSSDVSSEALAEEEALAQAGAKVEALAEEEAPAKEEAEEAKEEESKTEENDK